MRSDARYPSFECRKKSGKRDSNPRPQPWQGCALPTELFPHDTRKQAASDQTDNRSTTVASFRGRTVTRRLGAATPLPRPLARSRPITRRIHGGERDRTADLLNAIQALSQLSYAPWAPGVHECPGTTNDSRGRDGCQANGTGAKRPEGAEDRFMLVGRPARNAASDSGMLDT